MQRNKSGYSKQRWKGTRKNPGVMTFVCSVDCHLVTNTLHNYNNFLAADWTDLNLSMLMLFHLFGVCSFFYVHPSKFYRSFEIPLQILLLQKAFHEPLTPLPPPHGQRKCTQTSSSVICVSYNIRHFLCCTAILIHTIASTTSLPSSWGRVLFSSVPSLSS